jgi:hypothetical protein
MSIRTIGLLAITAAIAAGCSPAPGSAEWCKAVIEGKIRPTEAEVNANDAACSAVIMQEMMKGVQGLGQ